MRPDHRLADCAIVVHPRDNVAVARFALAAGTRVRLDEDGESSRVATIRGDVTPGNRFALADVPTGEFVVQYGQPIGTSRGIATGDAIATTNMANDVPVVRDLDAAHAPEAPDYVAEDERAHFSGFRRPDGRVGTRNWVLIVPTSMCASHEATQIAQITEFTIWNREKFPNVDGVVPIPHNKGCGCSDGENLDVLMRTLANFADHANVGAVLFIDLGCEKTNLDYLQRYLKRAGGFGFDKPHAWIGIQEVGGTQAAIEKGVAEVTRMLPLANETTRTPIGADELVLGVQCGGSDGFSGLSANPSLGFAADRLVANGGTVLLSEVPEFCGAEHVLAQRARDEATGRAVYAMVDWYKQHAATVGAALGENPSPGNIAGGLLNITIKSLGAIAKGGTTRVEGTLAYGERVADGGRGLHLMQGPGYDQESVPGLVASGANVVVFTTGRGSTIGNAIVPVIKLASNTPIYERMRGDLDLTAGGIVDGVETIPEVGARVFERIVEVADGRTTCAETTKHREFQVWGERAVSL